MKKGLMRISLFLLCIFSVFFISRVWVLKNPPKYYSDVKHDYERYANMWRYGLIPYRTHLYEYPPATIPLLSLPLELDQRGIGKFYINYRVQIFVFEIILFAFIVYELKKQKLKPVHAMMAIAFFIISGIVSKDFWYEGLDLIFFGTITIMCIWIVRKNQAHTFPRLVTWALFWLSVSIKLITFPLALPLLFLSKMKLKREILLCIAGAFIIWIAPLLMYRSSLSVFLLFHANRPMKYGAFGSYVIEVINDFTKSEYRIDKGPDFPMAGPVSNIVGSIDKVVFPISLAALMLCSAYLLYKHASKNPQQIDIQRVYSLMLSYIFVFFLTSKTFSSPFHIWYVPLITVYPYSLVRKRVITYALALIMLLLDTSPYLKVPNIIAFSYISLPHLRDAFRFIPMFILLFIFMKDFIKQNNIKAVLINTKSKKKK